MVQHWTPSPLDKLYDLILHAENEMRGELERLWELVKIFPEKWPRESYGPPEGFWVVAICGRNLIWYDDIEECFCTSEYTTYGRFAGDCSVSHSLQSNVQALLAQVQFGG